jgi:coproporphyrinogen III oxidase-like Fe-S oxidoreductase
MSTIAVTPASTPAPPLQKETAAGNYFVSNYPPYSFWKPEFANEIFEAIERSPRPGNPLGIYVHIPFCRKRCHFCYFKVYTDKDSAAIRGYLEGVLRELTIYAKKPFVGGRKPNFVYFGGGTPSYLSVDQLRHLTDGMKALLPWDEAEEVTFECEPGTLTDHKLKAIRELGVTRLSLGVENFDDHILEINGRAHHSKEIARAYAYAREVGFPQINIDLIAGMVGETWDNWRDCIRKTIALAPDSVTVYQMELPFNTVFSKELQVIGQEVPEGNVADWPTKRAWVDYAFNEMAKAGYEVSSAYTLVRDKQKCKFVYRDSLWHGADMFGTGVASFGHASGVHMQNVDTWEQYVALLDQGELPLGRALRVTPEQKLRRELMLQLKTGRLHADYFQSKFGADILKQFADDFDELIRTGQVIRHNGTVELTRAGLLQVDRLLPAFFEPEYRTGRYT